MSMKVLVTGGGGFLGSAIVRQLLERAYPVVSYSRYHHPALALPGVIQHRGNIVDYDQLAAAMDGCEAVFHVAAKVGYSCKARPFVAVNVQGTANVIKACKALKVPYLVFTSSASVIFDGRSEGGDESLPYLERYDAHYPHTKAIAEQMVREANGAGLVTCSLRPHLIWGPGDPHFLPRLLRLRRKNLLRVVGSGRNLVDTVYIDNAAKAHLQALDVMRTDPQAVGGKVYFLSQDEPMAMRTFLDRILQAGGLEPVPGGVPPRLALAAAWLIQGGHCLLGSGSEPALSTFIVRHLWKPHWFDISAAKRDLGYDPSVSTEEGMRRLKAWLGHGQPKT